MITICAKDQFEQLMGIEILVHKIVDYCYGAANEDDDAFVMHGRVDIREHCRTSSLASNKRHDVGSRLDRSILRSKMYFNRLALVNRACYDMIFGGNDSLWLNLDPIVSFPIRYHRLAQQQPSTTSGETYRDFQKLSLINSVKWFSSYLHKCHFRSLRLQFNWPNCFQAISWDKEAKLNTRLLCLHYDIDPECNDSVNLMDLFMFIFQHFERLNHLEIRVRQKSPLISSRFTKSHIFDSNFAAITFRRSLSLRTLHITLENHEWLTEAKALKVPHFLKFTISACPNLNNLKLLPFDEWSMLSDRGVLDAFLSMDELVRLQLYNVDQFELLQKVLDHHIYLQYFGLDNSQLKKRPAIMNSLEFRQCEELEELNMDRIDQFYVSNLPRSLERLSMNTCTVDFNDMDPELTLKQLLMYNCRLTSKFPWSAMSHLTELTITDTLVISKKEMVDLVITCQHLKHIQLSSVSKNHSTLLLTLARTPSELGQNLKTISLSLDLPGQVNDMTDNAITRVESSIGELHLSDLSTLSTNSFNYIFRSGLFAKLTLCVITQCRGLHVSDCIDTLSECCPKLYELKLDCSLLGTKKIEPAQTAAFKHLTHCSITENEQGYTENSMRVAMSIFACTYNPERMSDQGNGSYHFSFMDKMNWADVKSVLVHGQDSDFKTDEISRKYNEFLGRALDQFTANNHCPKSEN